MVRLLVGGRNADASSGGSVRRRWTPGVLVVGGGTQTSFDVLGCSLAYKSVPGSGRGTKDAGDGTVIAKDALGADAFGVNIFPILAD